MEREEAIESILKLLNASTKRELKQLEREVIVTQEALVAVIMAAQVGALSPYLYANKFLDHTPQHLNPTAEERNALGMSKVGEPMNKSAQKFLSKVSAIFEERRLFSSHLFYTPDQRYWNLFYFDQRDTSERNNHWKGGSHIHMITSLSNLELASVWLKVQMGDTNFSQKLHLRYERNLSR